MEFGSHRTPSIFQGGGTLGAGSRGSRTWSAGTTREHCYRNTPGQFVDGDARGRQRDTGGEPSAGGGTLQSESFRWENLSAITKSFNSHDRMKSAEHLNANPGRSAGRLSTAEATPLFQPRLKSFQLRHGQIGLRRRITHQPILEELINSSDPLGAEDHLTRLQQQIAIGLAAMAASPTDPVSASHRICSRSRHRPGCLSNWRRFIADMKAPRRELSSVTDCIECPATLAQIGDLCEIRAIFISSHAPPNRPAEAAWAGGAQDSEGSASCCLKFDLSPHFGPVWAPLKSERRDGPTHYPGTLRSDQSACWNLNANF
jgi:hypothetical protein